MVLVRFVWLDPLVSITKISWCPAGPSRGEEKRIFEPSGDQAGLFAVPPLGETWTWLDPSEFITQISLDLTKTIFELSGDQDGYL